MDVKRLNGIRFASHHERNTDWCYVIGYWLDACNTRLLMHMVLLWLLTDMISSYLNTLFIWVLIMYTFKGHDSGHDFSFCRH
nr:hypothetical protein [Tanacetum cinerariifolium]